MGIRPLTRRDGAGVVYHRPDEVERQIAVALTLAAAALLARAKVRDYRADGYLKDETLVYLVREFHRDSRDALVSELATILVERCRKAAHRRLRSLTDEQQEEAMAAILLRVFGEQITDLESDRGDFLQVRFVVALDRLAIRAFNDLVAERRRMDDTVPLSALAGYDADDDEDGARRVGRGELAAEPLLSPERLVLYREGLDQLPPKQREAFILRYYDGWPIDPPKDGGPSLTAHFRATSRTIRYWFAQSERRLREWADGVKEHHDGNP